MIFQITLLCVLHFVLSASPYDFIGTTSTTKFASPVNATSITCSLISTSSSYESFPVTIQQQSFIYITALFETIVKENAQIQFYRGNFNPQNPCSNLIQVGKSSFGAPHASILVLVEPDTYTVVITSRDANKKGLFSIHVDQAIWISSTLNGYWNPPSSFGSNCSSSTEVAPFTNYTFTWNLASGKYDIFIFGNSNDSTSLNASLYSGALQFSSSSISQPANSCVSNFHSSSSSTQAFVFAEMKLNNPNYAAALFLNTNLVSSQKYSLVMSMGDFPTFGVYIRLTTSIQLSNVAQFQRPELDFNNCTLNGDLYVYATRTFTANGAFYLMDNSRFDNSFVDTAICIYSGQFDLTSTCKSFSICKDTSDIDSVFIIPILNEDIIVVQTSFFAQISRGVVASLYIYSGDVLGSLPFSTTGSLIGNFEILIDCAAGATSSASTFYCGLDLISFAFIFLFALF